MLGIAFLIDGNHRLIVAPQSPVEVRRIFDQWANSMAPGGTHSVIRGRCIASNTEWMVCTSTILALHTINLNEQPQGQSPLGGPWISGRN